MLRCFVDLMNNHLFLRCLRSISVKILNAPHRTAPFFRIFKRVFCLRALVYTNELGARVPCKHFEYLSLPILLFALCCELVSLSVASANGAVIVLILDLHEILWLCPADTAFRSDKNIKCLHFGFIAGLNLKIQHNEKWYANFENWNWARKNHKIYTCFFPHTSNCAPYAC